MSKVDGNGDIAQLFIHILKRNEEENGKNILKAMENSRPESRTTNSPPKMEVLHWVQKNFATVGITPNLSHQPHPFSAKIAVGFVILSAYFVCNLMFTFFEANTLMEYSQSIYMGSLAILIILALFIIIFNVEKLFNLIDDSGNLVNASESARDSIRVSKYLSFCITYILVSKWSASKATLIETVQFEQKLSGIFGFVTLKLTSMCVFVPRFIYTYFIYFTTNAGNAVFELPFPIWYVSHSSMLNSRQFLRLNA